jgi:hypothetical protein
MSIQDADSHTKSCYQCDTLNRIQAKYCRQCGNWLEIVSEEPQFPDKSTEIRGRRTEESSQALSFPNNDPVDPYQEAGFREKVKRAFTNRVGLLYNRDESRHLAQMKQTYTKRLQLLEIQTAKFGNHTPPHIEIEIEDIHKKVEELTQRIQSYESTEVKDDGRVILELDLKRDFHSLNIQHDPTLIRVALTLSVSTEKVDIIQVSHSSIRLRIDVPFSKFLYFIEQQETENVSLDNLSIDNLLVNNRQINISLRPLAIIYDSNGIISYCKASKVAIVPQNDNIYVPSGITINSITYSFVAIKSIAIMSVSSYISARLIMMNGQIIDGYISDDIIIFPDIKPEPCPLFSMPIRDVKRVDFLWDERVS